MIGRTRAAATGALIAVVACFTFLIGAGARAQGVAVDAHAEVAAALYAASATQAVFAKEADAVINAQRAKITALAVKVKAGEAKRTQLAAEEEAFVAELAAKDRAYAQAIAVFRGAVSDIAATPEGAAALARFNAGDEVGALAVLDRLRAANDRARQKREDIESAAEGRRIAQLALDALDRGKVTTKAVIERFEDVVRLDPGVAADWQQLAFLYLMAGRSVDSIAAAHRALAGTPTDSERAWFLKQLGDTQMAQGDFASARASFEDALAIVHRLAASNPNATKAQWRVAMALFDVGESWYRGGDLLAGKPSFEASLAIARRLASVDKGPDLSDDDNIIGYCLDREGWGARRQGDAAGALALFQEGLKFFRLYAAASPSSVQAAQNVSMGLQDVGMMQLQLDDPPAALAAFEEMLAVDSRLAEQDPTSAINQQALGADLQWIAEVRKAQGDFPAARARYEESLAILRRLAVADPKSAEAQGDAEPRWLAEVEVLQGDLADAAATYSASADIERRLIAGDPADTDYRQNLIVDLAGVAQVAGERGDLRTARHNLDEALEIAHHLPTDPNARASVYLAWTLDRSGVNLRLGGDPKGARAAIAESVALSRILAAPRDGSTADDRQLVASLDDLGETLLALKDVSGARAAAEEALRLARGEAAAHPRSEDWAGELGGALYSAGEAEAAGGDPAAAARSDTESVDVLRRVAAAKPLSEPAGADLARALAALGVAKAAAGDAAGAIAADRESLAVARRLSAADPASATRRFDVARALSQLAALPNSGVAWAEPLAVLEDMEKRGILAPADRGRLEEARKAAAAPAAK